jgi:NAD(P)-dependent dehydrogenase (short-subunit alcohol dehydrogenase family)
MTTPAPDTAAGRLTGRSALVVGGGATHDDWPGTGSSTARLLAAAGASVAVMGRSEENTARTVREISSAGGTAVAIRGDASVESEAARAIGEVDAAFGRLDILVNNLGIGAPGSVAAVTLDDWERVLATNLTSVLLMTRHATALLSASPAASVINVGSIAGMRASGSLSYGTTKGALVAMTQEMAFDLGAKGIRVNLIVPGHLHTPSGSAFVTDDARQLRRDVAMLSAEGSAWDVAWTALFLAGDESRFLTAVTLPVDAGASQVLPLVAVARDRIRP